MRDNVPSLFTTNGPKWSSLTASPPTLTLVVSASAAVGEGSGRGVLFSDVEEDVGSGCWVSCCGVVADDIFVRVCKFARDVQVVRKFVDGRILQFRGKCLVGIMD